MTGSKKTNVETDKVTKQLVAFMKNAQTVDTIRDNFQGNFVAIFGQEVVGSDTEYNNLWNKIQSYICKPELYVSYIPKNDEVLVV
jgi:hypothetical protein